MAVGTFRTFVLDVNNLPVAERFWTSVLGWDLAFSSEDFSRVGKKGEASLLLQLVPEPKGEVKNRGHVDLTVDDVAGAVEEVLELGGGVVKPPGFYPDDSDPLLEWSVVCDPFGNEFCLIREVHPPTL
jgi:predicted enzyme related to lactoylglutathione lyase